MTSDRTTFGSLRIAFDARVLRPREWTAAQSEWAAELLPRLPAGPVLELCAGAGQIGLLAVVDSSRRLVCVDADETACRFARANADGARMADRVEVRQARLEEALAPEDAFPLIIADPPWVPGPFDPMCATVGILDTRGTALQHRETTTGQQAWAVGVSRRMDFRRVGTGGA